MKWLPLVLLAGCAVTPLRLAVTPRTLDARRLEGEWRVVATTFPMWLEGKKTQPRFGYSNLQTRDGVTTMDDRVSYLEDGRPGTIDGIDTQHAEVPTHFTWRGRGVLALFASDWDVVFIDEHERFAIITFTKTLATPAGLDVIAREALDDATWAEAQRVIAAEPTLASLATGLQRL